MFMKKIHSVILIALVFAPFDSGCAEDMTIDCKLKGGTVVKLPPEVCRMEEGAPVIEAVPQDSTAASAERAAGERSPADIKMAEAQWRVVDLLSKSVMEMTSLGNNPEGIKRAARFEDCRLMVDEEMHIEYGNAYAVWKNLKVSSVIDFRKIGREEFGVLGKVASEGGELKAAAVYVEERKRKEGNNISISVFELKGGGYAKHSSHGLSAYWDAPQDDLWMTDEYGYAKGTGFGQVATDKIRILLIVSSLDEAERLNEAMQGVRAVCEPESIGSE